MGQANKTFPCAVASRRDLLTGIATGALTLGMTVPSRAQSAPTLDRFIRISTRLCGTQLSSRSFCADILKLLSREFSAAQINTLAVFVETSNDVDIEVNFRAVGLERIVSRLIWICYSGIAPMKNGSEEF